jgi:hypothetical protein
VKRFSKIFEENKLNIFIAGGAYVSLNDSAGTISAEALVK